MNPHAVSSRSIIWCTSGRASIARLVNERMMEMATQADYGWDIPDLSDIADGPGAFTQFANDIAGTFKDKVIQSYTPAWQSNGSIQPGGTSSREGKYVVRNGWCDVYIRLAFGIGVSGGTGILNCTLPIPPSNVLSHGLFHTYLYTPGIGWFQGFASVNIGDIKVYPFFPVGGTGTHHCAQWINAPEGNPPGQGVPLINGNWAIMQDGDMSIMGRYYVG
jgi:hypothetical protein